MAPSTQPPMAFQWYTQGKKPPGGLLGNIFNPFSQPVTQQTPAGAAGASPFDMAGRYSGALQQAVDLRNKMGLDPKDPFTGALTLNFMNQILANDPEILKQQAGIYEGVQNRLADAANERAMKGHIFAGLLNLPNKWQEAMAEKYRFVPSTLQMAQQAGESRSPFQARQYINI